MIITLIAIGKRMPDWVEAGFAEYRKRLPSDYRLHLVEIAAGKRGKNTDIARVLQAEGQSMLAAVPLNNTVIALDRLGHDWNTQQLSGKLRDWHDSAQDISLLIGGPEGLDDACLTRADLTWSLSPLTFPHPIVRVILAEQLYRAWSLTTGHPYHR